MLSMSTSVLLVNQAQTVGAQEFLEVFNLTGQFMTYIGIAHMHAIVAKLEHEAV